MFSTIRVQGNWYLLVICFQIRFKKKMNQCVMFWSCDNCRIHKHFSFKSAVWGEKTYICFDGGRIYPYQKRVCPIKTDRCCWDILPVSTSTPPSRAPVCSVISVSVRIYQQNEMRKTQRSWLRPFLFLTTTGSLGFQSFTNIS